MLWEDVSQTAVGFFRLLLLVVYLFIYLLLLDFACFYVCLSLSMFSSIVKEFFFRVFFFFLVKSPQNTPAD